MLAGKDIITDTLAKQLRKMVGFRNIAVQEYETIDIEILKSILQKDLKDIEDFYTNVVRYYKLSVSEG